MKAPDTRNPLLFPGAQRIEKGHTARNEQIPITSFETTADPATILEFYKDALPKEGWDETAADLQPNELLFVWEDCCKHAEMVVTITTSETGTTKVVIEHPPLGVCTD